MTSCFHSIDLFPERSGPDHLMESKEQVNIIDLCGHADVNTHTNHPLKGENNSFMFHSNELYVIRTV